MTAILKNFIGGEWVDGSGVTKNINPSNTNDLVGEYAKADKAQTEKAIAAAKAAFPAWAQSTPQVRYDALNKISLEILARKEELGRLLAREEGKTLPEGIGEVARAGSIFSAMTNCVRSQSIIIGTTAGALDIATAYFIRSRRPRHRWPP